jgi:hypothetical protein
MSTYLQRLKATLAENTPTPVTAKTAKSPVFAESPNKETSREAANAPPNNWRVHLRKLPSTPCPDGFDPGRWAILLDGAVRFARDWSVKTISLGWTFEDLFALREPFANVTLQGAAWFIGRSTVMAVTADTITLRTESGSILRIYRKQRE